MIYCPAGSYHALHHNGSPRGRFRSRAESSKPLLSNCFLFACRSCSRGDSEASPTKACGTGFDGTTPWHYSRWKFCCWCYCWWCRCCRHFSVTPAYHSWRPIEPPLLGSSCYRRSTTTMRLVSRGVHIMTHRVSHCAPPRLRPHD